MASNSARKFRYSLEQIRDQTVAKSKIKASSSLLTATITFKFFIPARCWIAPEIPTATYNSGAKIFAKATSRYQIQILYPALLAIAIDPIWFGIVFVIMVECALITPPIGLNLFIMQAVGKATLGELSKGVVQSIFKRRKARACEHNLNGSSSGVTQQTSFYRHFAVTQ